MKAQILHEVKDWGRILEMSLTFNILYSLCVSVSKTSTKNTEFNKNFLEATECFQIQDGQILHLKTTITKRCGSSWVFFFYNTDSEHWKTWDWVMLKVWIKYSFSSEDLKVKNLSCSSSGCQQRAVWAQSWFAEWVPVFICWSLSLQTNTDGLFQTGAKYPILLIPPVSWEKMLHLNAPRRQNFTSLQSKNQNWTFMKTLSHAMFLFVSAC